MLDHWQRLAEAQRINQEIEAEFERALSQVGEEAAARVRSAVEGAWARRRRSDQLRIPRVASVRPRREARAR